MRFLKILEYIINHPFNSHRKAKAILEFIKWQIASRLSPFSMVYEFTEHSKLIVKSGMTGATGNLYCGLHEFEDMGFLLHALRKEDLFIDIGANIGSYTILAGAEVGCKVFAYEPVESTFETLGLNIRINDISENVVSKRLIVGNSNEMLNFTKSLDTVNHVVLGSKNEATDLINSVRLDDEINNLSDYTILKVDVEGFEKNVLEGATRLLENLNLKAIIIELNGSGARYGFDENDIHVKLLKLGFKPFKYDPRTRELAKVSSFGSHNTIYIRDLNFIKDRLKSGQLRKVKDQFI